MKMEDELVEENEEEGLDPEREYDTDCITKAKELCTDLKEKGYSQEAVTRCEALIALLEKQAGADEHDMDQYDKMNDKDMRKDMVKKGLIITIG